MNKLLDDPASFFCDLGGMHDAKILGIIFDASVRKLTLGLDDINANFRGLPEYGGKREASIVFSEVENIDLNCDALECDIQRIYDLEMLKKDDSKKHTLVMSISPSGRLTFDCEAVVLIGLEERGHPLTR